MLFRGTSENIIDNKGRVSVPSKFRPYLGEAVIVAKMYKRCLFIFPLSEWNKFEKKLQNISLTDEKAMEFRRIILSKSEEVTVDKSGRICLPFTLREEIKLNNEVSIIGNGHLIEIWNRDEFNKHILKVEENREDLMSYMKNIGF